MLEELLKEARGWLEDCGLEVIGRDQTVITVVNANYEGGWHEFVRADPSIDEAVVWLLMVRRFGLDFANRMFWATDNASLAQH